MIKEPEAFNADFDWEHLHQLADCDTAFEMELLQIFIEDLDYSLRCLTSAIAAHDAVTVEQIAHSIRGAAANIGAIAIAQIAALLEQQAQNEQWGQAADLLSQLQRHDRIVKQYLQEMSIVTG